MDTNYSSQVENSNLNNQSEVHSVVASNSQVENSSHGLSDSNQEGLKYEDGNISNQTVEALYKNNIYSEEDIDKARQLLFPSLTSEEVSAEILVEMVNVALNRPDLTNIQLELGFIYLNQVGINAYDSQELGDEFFIWILEMIMKFKSKMTFEGLTPIAWNDKVGSEIPISGSDYAMLSLTIIARRSSLMILEYMADVLEIIPFLNSMLSCPIYKIRGEAMYIFTGLIYKSTGYLYHVLTETNLFHYGVNIYNSSSNSEKDESGISESEYVAYGIKHIGLFDNFTEDEIQKLVTYFSQSLIQNGDIYTDHLGIGLKSLIDTYKTHYLNDLLMSEINNSSIPTSLNMMLLSENENTLVEVSELISHISNFTFEGEGRVFVSKIDMKNVQKAIDRNITTVNVNLLKFLSHFPIHKNKVNVQKLKTNSDMKMLFELFKYNGINFNKNNDKWIISNLIHTSDDSNIQAIIDTFEPIDHFFEFWSVPEDYLINFGIFVNSALLKMLENVRKSPKEVHKQQIRKLIDQDGIAKLEEYKSYPSLKLSKIIGKIIDCITSIANS